MHSLGDSTAFANLFSIPTTSNCSSSPISSLSFGSLPSNPPYSTSGYGSRTLSSACSDLGSHNILSSGSSGCTSIGSSPIPNEQNLIGSPTYQNCSNQNESVLNETLNSDVLYLNNFTTNDLTARSASQAFSPNSKLVFPSVPLDTFSSNQVYDYGKEKIQNRGTVSVTTRKMAKPDSFKTVMCKGWLEMGGCGFGQNCRFAHGEEELRPSKIPVDNPKYKTKLCDKYTKTGVCPYGDRCLFIHPESSNGIGLETNPYIHPDRMAQILKERGVPVLNVKRSTEDLLNPKNMETKTSSWFLKTSKATKNEDKRGEDLRLTQSQQLSSPRAYKLNHFLELLLEDGDQMRALSDITNNGMGSLTLAVSNNFFISSKPSPDSGTEFDGDTGWGVSTRIADPFDFAIESDNMARSLAIDFAKPF